MYLHIIFGNIFWTRMETYDDCSSRRDWVWLQKCHNFLGWLLLATNCFISQNWGKVSPSLKNSESDALSLGIFLLVESTGDKANSWHLISFSAGSRSVLLKRLLLDIVWACVSVWTSYGNAKVLIPFQVKHLAFLHTSGVPPSLVLKYILQESNREDPNGSCHNIFFLIKTVDTDIQFTNECMHAA